MVWVWLSQCDSIPPVSLTEIPAPGAGCPDDRKHHRQQCVWVSITSGQQSCLSSLAPEPRLLGGSGSYRRQFYYVSVGKITLVAWR
jgi:hypothetical protein